METGVNVEVFKGLISTAPAALAANKESVSKAEQAGNMLMSEIQKLAASENGKPDFEARKALDAKLNNYLTRVGETMKALKERRMPITGLFDDFKKMFTTLEAKIDPKADTFPGKIQATRNRWASDLAAENQRIQAEQQKQRAIEAEKIAVKTQIELQLRTYFLEYIESEQRAMTYHFENLTLQAFDFESEKLINYKPVYPFGNFEAFKPAIQTTYLAKEDVSNILVNAKAGKFDEFCAEFNETMKASKESFVEKLASKKAELEELQKASEAERLKLELDKSIRQKQEDDRIKAESEKKKAEAAQQAETTQKVAQTNMLFEMQTSAITQDNVKEGCEILVKNANGWLQIVAFYFEKEGLKKLPDDLANMKLDQMRAFCEKHYLKTSEKIQSVALEYKDVYKAVNKK